MSTKLGVLVFILASALATSAYAAKSSGHGGGHSGGGHSAGGAHASHGGGGRGRNGGHGHVARSGDRPGHPGRFGRPTHWTSRGHGHWIFRDGRWIVIDPVDGDLPDEPPASPGPTNEQTQEGQCLVSVYWDADFKGERWDVEQNQHYVGNHWNDQISSIRVVSGIWRFYWDADYGGEMIELKPGDYRYVGNHWNDQISSFRCIGSDSTSSPQNPELQSR